jgi:hypothetical protein
VQADFSPLHVKTKAKQQKTLQRRLSTLAEFSLFILSVFIKIGFILNSQPV